jgi:cell division protein FtsB
VGDSDDPAPPAPPERDTAFLVSAGIALVAVFVLARNLLPVKQDLADTNRRIESLKAERDALTKEREVLEKKEKALQGDDAYLERTLRGQTGMSKPGEFIVK